MKKTLNIILGLMFLATSMLNGMSVFECPKEKVFHLFSCCSEDKEQTKSCCSSHDSEEVSDSVQTLKKLCCSKVNTEVQPTLSHSESEQSEKFSDSIITPFIGLQLQSTSDSEKKSKSNYKTGPPPQSIHIFILNCSFLC